MPAMSDYLENKLVDFLFRGFALAAPAHLYVALCTAPTTDADTGSTLTEVSGVGTGYARQQLDPAAGNWSNTQGAGVGASTGAGGTTANSLAINFGTAIAGWGTITHIAIVDAASGGNVLFHGALTTPRTVDAADGFQFAIGQLQVQMDN